MLGNRDLLGKDWLNQLCVNKIALLTANLMSFPGNKYVDLRQPAAREPPQVLQI